MITKEMRELMGYLARIDGYVIFAGFAGFLQTGVEASEDIDIFTKSIADIAPIAEDFVSKGWKLTREENDGDRWAMKTVEKNGTTFDICCNTNASRVLVPRAVEVEFEGYKLKVLSPESLLVSKMAQLTGLHRSPEKTLRDRKVLEIIRKRVDPEEARKLTNEMSDEFWTKGYT